MCGGDLKCPIRTPSIWDAVFPSNEGEEDNGPCGAYTHLFGAALPSDGSFFQVAEGPADR